MTSTSALLDNVCKNFALTGVASVTSINSGLINSSYKITLHNSDSYFLQQINPSVFKMPMALQMNYLLIEEYLSACGQFHLPKLIQTASGALLFEDRKKTWRCFEFFDDTYTPTTIQAAEQAYEVARCFGMFTAQLHNFDSRRLETVLPRFHDLSFRYTEFKTALQQASKPRIESIDNLVHEIEERADLVNFYRQISKDNASFPIHILHHDCKVSNILFDVSTGTVRCPIDLDTTQPGLFFSDIGDMIRTIVPNKDENNTDLNDLQIREHYFEAVMNGYLDAMADCLTAEEKANLPKAGLLMTYMQAMRFATDYLNGNIYYRTQYEEQNKDRTANQLQLLRLLREYINRKPVA